MGRAEELMEEGLKPIIVYGELKNVRKPRVKWRKRWRRNNRSPYDAIPQDKAYVNL